ncbi:MerR family transcriptional regulator [Leifsonia naganoensis]|uniref:DNA-binding transcriptional MerR regulator n=1 Tax=Leifsonia naganoensis TaxID=150025 RepID=A0A853DLJ9_9MICO|nr:DNA-binding transcriptional MerR regulator [Leifsonia naganoensis]
MTSIAAVATASGYSRQQIRDLERLGVIPPAERGPNGYRSFDATHIRALRVYRGAAAAVGPVEARRVLREAWTLPLADAAALLGALHVGLAREREQAEAALRALRTIRSEGHGRAQPDDVALTIAELADALGVRASTLRFWEQEGLVAPDRVTSRGARSYPPAAAREARIVAALRAAGYRIPAVRSTIDAIRRSARLDDPERSLVQRIEALAQRTLALLEAGADAAALLRERV